MEHIFISHATADADIAKRLELDLRNAGHETRIDTRELRLGDDTIEFINDAIASAATIIILYSSHTPHAAWQKLEIEASLWNRETQGGARCVVIRLDDSPLPPLLGPGLFATLTDDRAYREVLERLCEALQPSPTAANVVADAFSSQSPNPFRRVRAEYFEDLPGLLGRTFAPPDPMVSRALEEMKPCFLEGSRGTGKSMLLLSLRARNLAERRRAGTPITDLFGFYLKLTRGAVCNAGLPPQQGSDPSALARHGIAQASDIFCQEIIICLVESLFSELAYCVDHQLIACEQATTSSLVSSVWRLVFGKTAGAGGSFKGLEAELAEAHRSIAEFVRRKFIYDESVPVPIASLDIECFRRIINCIKSTIPVLANCTFVALLDEYENLFPFQQRVVNSLVKLGPPHFTVKAAKRLGSSETSATTMGQELQEIHDFNRRSLVYDVEDPRQLGSFRELLSHITQNMLCVADLTPSGMDIFLPPPAGPEVDQESQMVQVAQLSKMSLGEFSALPGEQQRGRFTYYGTAGIYRAIYGARGGHRSKHFAGFDELAVISSGVIRYFLETLGVAYHLEYGDNASPHGPAVISPDNQTRAVHLVSTYNLTTLSRNIEVDGERLKYYVLDLGDCLRHKLMKHTSEPEAGRVTVVDPERLELPEFHDLKCMLEIGVREGVFQTREGRPGFKPKHHLDPQPSEFNISRIFAPVLQISPRFRWRTNVTCAELGDLLRPERRAEAKKNLMRRLVKEEPAENTAPPPQVAFDF